MTSQHQPAATIPPVGQYQVAPHVSSIAFTTKAVFGLVTVRGTFDLVSATMSVVEPVTASTAQAAVSVASFKTKIGKRDRHVKSGDFLNVAQYPTIVFAGNEVTFTDGAWVLHGMLTVRGMPSPVQVTVGSFHVEGAALTVQAAARVDRYAFGVNHSQGMAGRYLNLDLHLVAHRS